jgi:phosphohistidine phosphatase
MKLILVRHGEAENIKSSDAARVLTARGRAQAGATGKWLAERLAHEASVKVLSSSYQRAHETALILASCLRTDVIDVAALTPDHDVRTALAAIVANAGDGDCVVVVTHMPLVAALAHWLEAAVFASGEAFSVAEARVFELPFLVAGAGVKVADHVPGLA